MPHSTTTPSLPFSGSCVQSRHASYQGAVDASARAGRQTRRYLGFLAACGAYGATDWEAAEALGVERTTINARRNELVRLGRVVAGGFRPGPTGVRNTVWTLRRDV